MIEQHPHKQGRALRRCWKTAFALLLAASVAVSLAPNMTASTLYFVSDGISTFLTGGTERADESRIVVQGVTVDSGDVTMEEGRKVVIRRGESEIYATSRANESVSALLQREGVALSPLEMVFVDLSGEDVVLAVAADHTYYETASEAIAYGTTYQTDYTLPKGTTAVTRAGENGVREVTVEVIYADGRLSSRQRIGENVRAAVDEVVSTGTLVKEAQPGDTIASVVTKEDGSGYLLMKSGDSLHFTGKMTVTCTAYSSEQRTVGTITATGTRVKVGVVAVDRRVIPLGTKMFITSNDGVYTYGMGSAEDTGVFGKSVDLYMDTIRQCMQFGRRPSTVYFLDK